MVTSAFVFSRYLLHHLRESTTCLVWVMAVSASGTASINAQNLPPFLQWNFAATESSGDQLSASIGRGTGRVVGGAKLAANPQRIEFNGQSRVVISDALPAIGLPAKTISIETWVRVDQVAKWCGFVSAIQDNGDFERGWLLGGQNGHFCFGLVSSYRPLFYHSPLFYITLSGDARID